MEGRVELQVGTEHSKMRLEDFLLDHFATLSKMYLRQVVRDGKCEVNGRPENIGYRLRPDDFLEIAVDHSRGTAMRPEKIALDILFEDEQIIVVNKPAGMLVHPSHRENSCTLLNALAHYLNNSAPRTSRSTRIRPGLIHRLDKQTSGLIVVAKIARAHRILSGHFMRKRVEKRYVALVEGIVEQDSGVIEAPIGRYADLKQWSIKPDGKHSETRFIVRKRFADTSVLDLEPVTGRTNQLRIHCEMIGHPIVGDTRRGGREFTRLCLHAQRLAFPHPLTNEIVQFEAPVEFGWSSPIVSYR